MRSMRATPMGWRPTRPLVGYSGSITAIRRDHGTTRSMSARNCSRRVGFFFIAYSGLANKAALVHGGPAAVFDAFTHAWGMPDLTY